MTKIELQAMVEKGFTDAASRVFKGIESKVHQHLADCHRDNAETYAKIAKAIRSGDDASQAKAFEDAGRKEQMRFKNTASAEYWERMNAAVGADDETREQDKHPIRDGKCAKSDDAVDQFFKQFYRVPEADVVSSDAVRRLFE